MSEKFWYLKNCDLFGRLTDDQLADLEKRARSRDFPRRSAIYLPADQGDAVYLVASGRVKISSFTTEGKQAILTFVEPGELFGELAIFGDDAREEYAESVDATKVILIPADAIQQLMETHANVALGVTKIIGLRRRRIERRLKYLLFRSNRERLSHLLLELAEQYGRRTEEGVRLTIKLSHQELANIIGSTRETVTVLLGELQAEGYLSVGRRTITVKSLEKLAESVSAAVPRLQLAESKPPAP